MLNQNLNQKQIASLSVTKWYEPFLHVFVLIVSYFAFKDFDFSSTELVLIMTAVLTFFMFGIEFFKQKWTFADRSKQDFRQVVDNFITKYIGILFGIALILFCYWLFPEYAKIKYFTPIEEAKILFFPVFLPLSLALVFFTEWILGNKKDGTYNFGLLVRLKINEINWSVFKDGVLEWLIRLVFLTLNFTSSVTLLEKFRQNGLPSYENNFVGSVIAFEQIIFLLILLVILPGYLFSSRLIGTEVRKIDKTLFAWTVLLVCYQPIFPVIFSSYLDYVPTYFAGPVWSILLAASPIMLTLFGAGILLLALVHLWGEAIIGIRSSNISNRGIITNGPFLITKHPVYVSKAFGWFLISLPFFNGINFEDGFRTLILFLGICLIYVFRSYTEEKLLFNDPIYDKYATFMDKHGMFAFVGKYLPFMSYAYRKALWEKEHYDK